MVQIADRVSPKDVNQTYGLTKEANFTMISLKNG